ncbi:MAG TPA: ABC transporter substrate-binding protein [Stellaceae bacterium]|nr:ABC transporter substrate-binding protein [Stellaceae bacterium]
MRRRDFIPLPVAVALASIPAAAQQPARVPRVGVLTPADSAATPIFEAFRKGLRDLGYIEGRTIVLDFRFAKGDLDALPGLARELVDLPADLIVTDSTTAALAAFRVTRTLPIVMGIATGNPVEVGLAASLAHPGGNVTGMTLGTLELNGKRLELIKQAFPAITHVALLLNVKNSGAQAYLASTKNAGATLGERFTVVAATSPADLGRLGPSDLAGADALAVLPDAMFWNHRHQIIALAERARLPAIYPEREYADDGGLITYGPNVPDAFRRAAGYVDRILRGAKPGDLPIDEAAKFDFVINLRTAHKLGLALPPTFLARADEVIE